MLKISGIPKSDYSNDIDKEKFLKYYASSASMIYPEKNRKSKK